MMRWCIKIRNHKAKLPSRGIRHEKLQWWWRQSCKCANEVHSLSLRSTWISPTLCFDESHVQTTPFCSCSYWESNSMVMVDHVRELTGKYRQRGYIWSYPGALQNLIHFLNMSYFLGLAGRRSFSFPLRLSLYLFSSSPSPLHGYCSASPSSSSELPR